MEDWKLHTCLKAPIFNSVEAEQVHKHSKQNYCWWERKGSQSLWDQGSFPKSVFKFDTFFLVYVEKQIANCYI